MIRVEIHAITFFFTALKLLSFTKAFGILVDILCKYLAVEIVQYS